MARKARCLGNATAARVARSARLGGVVMHNWSLGGETALHAPGEVRVLARSPEAMPLPQEPRGCAQASHVR